MHALVIYGFASGLAQRVVERVPEVLQAVVIADPVKRPPPPPPVAQFRPRRIEVVQSLLEPARVEFPPLTESVTPTVPRPSEPVELAPVHQPKRVWGAPSQGFPNTDDYYPAVSRRLEETGTANVQVCVDAQGRLTAQPTLATSSGNHRLDEAALTLAKAGSGHYRASTDDGQPVDSCFAFRIRFRLDN